MWMPFWVIWRKTVFAKQENWEIEKGDAHRMEANRKFLMGDIIAREY